MKEPEGNGVEPDGSNHPVRKRLDAGEFVVGLTIVSNNLEAAVPGADRNLLY